jgi:hypothetical protein
MLVKNSKSLISIGTEMAAFSGDYPEGSVWEEFFPYPFDAGYATVGEVIEVGKNVDKSWLGKLVGTMAPHCRYAVVPAAFKLMMPVSLAKVIAPVNEKIAPGNYRLVTWVKAENYSNLSDKPNKLKLRLSWISAEGKAEIRERQMPVPEGKYDWKAFEFKVKVPEGAKELTILQSCWKFYYCKGTLFVEFPQLLPDK